MVDGLGSLLLVGLLEGSPKLRLQVGERVKSYGSDMSAVWFCGSCRQPDLGCLLVDRGRRLLPCGCGTLTNTWHFGGWFLGIVV